MREAGDTGFGDGFNLRCHAPPALVVRDRGREGEERVEIGVRGDAVKILSNLPKQEEGHIETKKETKTETKRAAHKQALMCWERRGPRTSSLTASTLPSLTRRQAFLTAKAGEV